jgi:cell division protein ZapA
MSVVKATIAGKDYNLACEDGQEQQLDTLVRAVDGRANQLMRQLGSKVPENMLLLYTALMVADELHDAKREMRKLVNAMEQAGDRAKIHRMEDQIAEEINGLAARAEALAARMDT